MWTRSSWDGMLLTLRLSIDHPKDAATWEMMTTIKSAILRMWDTAAAGVRICCIKFVQRVIQVQTPGPVADPEVSGEPRVRDERCSVG